MSRGHREAMTIPEMIDEQTGAKERQLTAPRGKSLYKAESGAYQTDELKKLIALHLDELAEVATREKISLSDVNEVKRRTIYYLRACEESGTFPSNLGLARSLGYSDRSLRHWRSQHPETPTAQWLEAFGDLCSDILSQSALKCNAQPIVSIFLQKSLYGLRETSELVLTPNRPMADAEDAIPVDEIKQRYLNHAPESKGGEG